MPFQSRIRRLIVAAVISSIFVYPLVAADDGDWTQWGGPHRNFTVETSGLADQWPEGGPPRLWERDLGEGYNAILYDNGVLYTMYRKASEPENEYAIALDSKTGKTLWENGYPSPAKDVSDRYPGPNAAPLIVGDRLFTLGFRGVLTCHQKKDGAVLWRKDLPEVTNAPIPRWGCSPGPIAYRNTVIVPVGCAMPNLHPTTQTAQPSRTYAPPSGQSLLALDQQNGELIWKSLDFMMGHSSPILIQFGGRDMLVLYTCTGVAGVDPANGRSLWNYPLEQDHTDAVITTPVWNGEDLLYFESGEAGFVLKLSIQDECLEVQELWRSGKVALGIGTPIVTDGVLIGSKRGNQPLILGVDFATGERTCFARALPAATVVQGDGKIIALDCNGVLALATATREHITIRSQCQVTQRWSFTPPTLVDSTLYIRDTRKILALDLGVPSHDK